MARKNLSSDKDDKELKELIAQYETMKAEGKPIYMDGDQLADIADKYATDRRFEEAQEVITHGLSLHPGNTDLTIEQSYLYLDTQKLQKAMEVANSITEAYAIEVKLLKAELLLNQGQLDAADELLNTIEEKDDLDVMIEVSYLFIDMGYSEKALPWLSRGLEKYNEEEDYLAVTADCYCAGNHLEKAEFFYNKLIDKNAYYPPYWLGLAKCHFAAQEYTKALEAADFALAADDQFGDGHLMKAHCLFHLNNQDEAIAEYQKALELKVLSPDFCCLFTGLALSDKEEWEAAEEQFRRARAIIEENSDLGTALLPDIYCNQALCLSRMGQGAEAHRLCKKAQSMNPNDPEAYLLEGRIFMEEENDEEGRKRWAKALECSPTAETWYQVGTSSIDMNMIENARFCFEQAMELDPTMKGLAGELASICLILKDHKGFYKYNLMSENPLNFDTIFESLQAIGSSELTEEIKNFMQEVLEENEEEEEEEEEEKKN